MATVRHRRASRKDCVFLVNGYCFCSRGLCSRWSSVADVERHGAKLRISLHICKSLRERGKTSKKQELNMALIRRCISKGLLHVCSMFSLAQAVSQMLALCCILGAYVHWCSSLIFMLNNQVTCFVFTASENLFYWLLSFLYKTVRSRQECWGRKGGNRSGKQHRSDPNLCFCEHVHHGSNIDRGNWKGREKHNSKSGSFGNKKDDCFKGR